MANVSATRDHDPRPTPRHRRTRPGLTLALAPLLALAVGCGPSIAPSPTTPGGTSPTPTITAPTTKPSPTAATATSSAPPPSGPTGLRIELERVADGFDRPLLVTNAGDGSGRLFVVEQGGRVWIVEDGERLPAPFLDIAERISSGGERGLLGLAFHPDYPTDPRVFVDYTDRKGDTVVASFVAGADADALDPASARRVIGIAQPYGNHNGGALAFDPSGRLLVAMGDGGAGGDPQDRAEDRQQLLGKILRLEIDGLAAGRGYAIPDDNPFVEGSARPEILHLGLRNPWRLSIDRTTGDLWIGDVGQGSIEEIDVARSGQSGLDFGWDTLEGSRCNEPRTGCDRAGRTMPVAEYTHAAGCTVVGGYVSRGEAQPALAGRYLYADYCSGTIWALDAADPGPPVVVAETDRQIASFGEDEAGGLYIADIGTGDILRIVAGP